MRICVIGSGVFGIAVMRELGRVLPEHSTRHWFSEDTEAGGLWNAHSRRSRVYDALYLNTSRESSAFTGTRIDAAPGVHFVHHTRYAAYLAETAGRCPATERRWGCPVTSVSAQPGGGWLVRYDTPDGAREETFDVVVDATGHSGEPHAPDVPTAARTDYARLHSARYRNADAHRGQRVLVVGNGASAVDIACELTGTAAAVGISIRTPKWYLPKMLLGRPVDRSSDGGLRHTPVLGPLVAAGTQAVVRRIVGSYRDYGLEEPRTPLAAATPVLSDHFLAHLAHGRLTPYPGVAELGETAVRFTDGSSDKFDTVITATGYRDTSEHLPPPVRDMLRHGRLGLRLEAPGFPALYLLNRFRCGDAAVRCAEVQAAVVARALLHPPGEPGRQLPGRYAVPARITARTLQKVYEVDR
ncbi:NAD(P)/FAD-dependent oxidoreductase [Streptomyces sp. NPDC023723]|uniref:flavin-containing monooxygenase n=1 Tax=Streptomyces sp. NPDC023723 TaxID=3154323 RepID=UPI0034098496